MGASGSGKSVMLKMLIGLIKPDAGKILFDGRDVTTMSENELTEVRRRIAYLFQGAALFDSLSRGRKRRLRPARAVLEQDDQRRDPGARRAVARPRRPARHRGHAAERSRRAA